MQIEMRPLADIKPYEQNPRINDAAVDAVAESIRRFGLPCDCHDHDASVSFKARCWAGLRP